MYKHIPKHEQILYEGGYKASLLLQYLKYPKRLPLANLLKELLLRTRLSQGKSTIRSISDEGKYFKIRYKQFTNCLYYPKDLPIYDLFLVSGENFTPTNWHYYEELETSVGKEDIVVDCGAAVGTFSLSVIERCKKLYAIEPLPKFISAMIKTFKDCKNFELIPLAVGEKKNSAEYIFDGSFGSLLSKKNKGIKVRLTTIDELFYKKKRPVTYLKADLEGWEMQMLKGAKQTIKKYKPKIVITTYHKKNDHIKIMRLLKKINPSYRFKLKGIDRKWGNPVMLHAW